MTDPLPRDLVAFLRGIGLVSGLRQASPLTARYLFAKCRQPPSYLAALSGLQPPLQDSWVGLEQGSDTRSSLTGSRRWIRRFPR